MKSRFVLMAVLALATAIAEAAPKKKRAASRAAQPRVGREMPQDLTQSLDNMNSDQDVIRRAKELSTDTRVEVVQNRAVDRTNKHEFTGIFGVSAFGDSYLRTQNFGAQYDYHIDNHWSVGARYYSYSNSLTAEGKSIMDNASDRKAQGLPYRYPQIDNPIASGLATVTWYPIYGKSNMFNLNVVHFDFYTVAGAGRIQLDSGQTNTFTAGGGFGIWWNQWLSSRLELRWQTYNDKHFDGDRTLNLAVATFGMGVMF